MYGNVWDCRECKKLSTKKRGIFQGDSLSPLLFALSMIPLSLVLRKVNACYEWEKKEYKLNHLLFMDDLKLFGKNEEQID